MTGKQVVVFCILLSAITLSLIDWPARRPRGEIPIELASAPMVMPLLSSAVTQPSQILGARQIHLLPKPGELRVMSIKQLGNFDYETDKRIPQDVRALSGMTVRLSGYMLITSETEHIHEFALVPDLYTCCYGQQPAVQHIVMVTCPKQQPVEYIFNPINLEGTLTVKELKEDGYVTSLFQVAAKNITAAK